MLDQSYTLTLGQINIVAVHQDEIGLANSLLGQQLHLVPRQGGERVHLLGRVGHRPLKKLLQDAKIAPWERHQTQILMYHNDIIGVLTTQGFWLVEQPFLEKGGWLPRILI